MQCFSHFTLRRPQFRKVSLYTKIFLFNHIIDYFFLYTVFLKLQSPQFRGRDFMHLNAQLAFQSESHSNLVQNPEPHFMHFKR